MAEYISKEAVFQVVYGIARRIADRDTAALKAKDMKAFYRIKGAKEILDSVDTDLCYIPVADVQPVKRGSWIAENRDNRGYADCYTCTNCHCYTYTYTLMKDCEYDYCPRCGARMSED